VSEGAGLIGKGPWWGIRMVNSDFNLIEKEIRKNILKKDIISIILFGSAVDSVEKANDYDFLIVTKKRIQLDWIIAGTIKYNLIGRVKKPVDIIFLEESDLKYGSPFLYEVGRKFKLISGKDISMQFKTINIGINPLMEGGCQVGWQVA